jgi:hypothetical protein
MRVSLVCLGVLFVVGLGAGASRADDLDELGFGQVGSNPIEHTKNHHANHSSNRTTRAEDPASLYLFQSKIVQKEAERAAAMGNHGAAEHLWKISNNLRFQAGKIEQVQQENPESKFVVSRSFRGAPNSRRFVSSNSVNKKNHAKARAFKAHRKPSQ